MTGKRSTLPWRIRLSMIIGMMPIGLRLLGLTCQLILFTGPSLAQEWQGPHDWAGCINPGYACTTVFPEISHAALIPTGIYQGKVLFWHRSVSPTTCLPSGKVEAWIWDPLSPAQITQLSQPYDGDIFCAGTSWDSRGQLIIAGGFRPPTIQQLQDVVRFKPGLLTAPTGDPTICGPAIKAAVPPSSPPWYLLSNSMAVARYYPTVIALSKRTITFVGGIQVNGGANLVIGGGQSIGVPGNTLLEFLPYGSNTWSPSVQAPGQLPAAADVYSINELNNPNPPTTPLDSYPRAIQLSTGDILVTHDVDTIAATPPLGNDRGGWWVIRPYGPYSTGGSLFELWRGMPLDPYDRNYGTAVLLHQLGAVDRVLVFGGFDFGNYGPTPPFLASNQVKEFISGNGNLVGGAVVNGAWVPKSPMASPRNHSNAVVLPTGEILLTGGESQLNPAPSGPPLPTPVLQAELYDPQSPILAGSTTLLPPSNSGSAGLPTARLYHHTAVLLMDGSVFIAGGEAPPPGTASRGEYSADVFRPSYMKAKRPFIFEVPSIVDLNPQGSTANRFIVTIEDLGPTSRIVDRVVLTRPAAVTHFFDSDQRYIELAFSNPSGDPEKLEIVSPSEALGPPGFYMIWVIVRPIAGGERVPTPARMIYLR